MRKNESDEILFNQEKLMEMLEEIRRYKAYVDDNTSRL